MSRIYIDLTTSIRWRRPPVGIVRVEREFAAYCLAHEPDTVFCEIDPSGTYRVVTATRVRTILDETWCRAEPVSTLAAQPTAPPLQVRGRVQRFFDAAAAWGPKVVPAAAYPLLRDLGRVLVDHHAAYARHHAAKQAQGTRSRATSIDASPQRVDAKLVRDAPITPDADDLFFSIGLQWHHGAIHAYRLKQRTGVRVVEACYDTIPIDFPEYAGSAKQPFAEYFTCISHTADVVFAISDTTRTDLAAFYARVGALHVPPIRTVHLATPETHVTATTADLSEEECAALDRLRRKGDYVLYVSTFETRKNHRLLLQVWKDLYKERRERCPTLVFVGMFGWGVGDLWAEIQATDVWAADKIVMLHHVSDALLAHLYRECVFTVFPSFYEGWGLAATESLAYGKLAITSDAPALREATQGLCPSIHPLDFPRWLETITHYLDDAAARTAAETRIRASYRPRHWDTFSRELLAAAREGQ